MSAPTRSAVTRRSFLGLAGLAVAATAGCTIETIPPSSGAAVSPIQFPTYPSKLPTSQQQLRWVDSGDLKGLWVDAVLAAFTKKHANIRTDYDGSGWATVNQVVPLGIRNGSAHDVFQTPQGVQPRIAISEGWVRPLDDIVPDFENWKAAFPKNAFIPGIHVFDGKTYTFPGASSKQLFQLAVYDAANLKRAGYDDPASQIRTWDELHTALKKVVATGRGGLLQGADTLSNVVSALANTIGWPGIQNGDGMDMRTGKYAWDAPEILEAFEFLQKLVTDKLVVPGFLTAVQKDVKSQITAGKAAMVFDGGQDVPAWKQLAPKWEYRFAATPGQKGLDYVVPYTEHGSAQWFCYADSPLADAVGQLFAYMGSPEGQRELVITTGAALGSVMPDANVQGAKEITVDANTALANRLYSRVMREAPMPEVRNPDTALVTNELKPVVPNWKSLMQGIFTGQLSNPEAQFAKFTAANEAALDTAIAAAVKKGAKVSRDDYVFPNWKPENDYRPTDYAELKK